MSTKNNGTQPHAGHIRLRGRELYSGGRVEKPSSFSETTGEILLDEEQRERERLGEAGKAGKKWDGWTSESASSRVRAETRWNGWAITLPGEPCLTLFRCPLSSCSRPPVCVHPSLLDPPASISPERTAAIQPSLDYNRALTSRSTVRFPAPSLVPSRPVSLLRAIRGRIEAEHGLGGLSIECHFRWPIVGNFGLSFNGGDFANFRAR